MHRKEWRYYGYKLHAVCGISGAIHSYDMTAANVYDLHYLNDVRWGIQRLPDAWRQRLSECEGSTKSFRCCQNRFGSSISVESEELETSNIGLQKVQKMDGNSLLTTR